MRLLAGQGGSIGALLCTSDFLSSKALHCTLYHAEHFNVSQFQPGMLIMLACTGGGVAGAKFGTAKCGTAKLYHILLWYLRTELRPRSSLYQIHALFLSITIQGTGNLFW